MFGDVEWPWRLSVEFRPNHFGVVAPRFEISAKRMKQHDLLRLSGQSDGAHKRLYQAANNCRCRVHAVNRGHFSNSSHSAARGSSPKKTVSHQCAADLSKDAGNNDFSANGKFRKCGGMAAVSIDLRAFVKSRPCILRARLLVRGFHN